MVFRRTRVQRSTFRNLPFGAVYYTNATSGPSIKMGRRAVLATNTFPSSTSPSGTAVSDTSIAVMRVGKARLGSQIAI